VQEKSNERKGSGGRGACMGRAGGARGARAGPGRVGLGHIAGRNPRHAQPPIGIRSRTKIQNGMGRTRD
jgi:hypothetical protein